MEYIRTYYGVNAKRGGRIVYKNKSGTIVGSKGPYLRIRLDGEKKIGNYHPTYEITYL
jgi:hypothetical protein